MRELGLDFSAIELKAATLAGRDGSLAALDRGYLRVYFPKLPVVVPG